MNLEKFTTRSQELIKTAVDSAVAGKRQYVTALMLLNAIMQSKDSVVEKLINESGGNAENLKAAAERAVAKIPQVSGNVQTVMSQDLSAVVLAAEQVAEKANDKFVTVERLLQALAMTAGNEACDLLKANGVSYTLRRTRDSRTICLSCDGNDANDDISWSGAASKIPSPSSQPSQAAALPGVSRQRPGTGRCPPLP